MEQPRAEPLALQPTEKKVRIASIDVMRGVVILGILPMNMQLVATVEGSLLSPMAAPWTDSWNVLTWALLHVFLGHKDLTVFSMLFGAGIAMMTDRSPAGDRSATLLHLRRMAVLLGIGLLHAYLVWPGDILVTYALAGLAVFPLRRLSNRWLLVLGGCAYAVPMLLLAGAGYLIPHLPVEVQHGLSEFYAPSAATLAAHHQAWSVGWLEQLAPRAVASLQIQLVLIPFGLLWVAGGMMLVGIALYRWGVFHAERSERAYLGMVALAMFVGLPFVLYGLWRNFAAEWEPTYAMTFGRLYSESVQPLMAVGWVGLWMLICKRGLLQGLTRRLAAVGQTALSNYLMQSLLLSFIFYGHGLGLIGRVDRIGQLGIVLVIWGIQLVIAPAWLGRFRFGPAEWIWRSLTYARPLRLKSEDSKKGHVTKGSAAVAEVPGRRVISAGAATKRVALFILLLVPFLGAAFLAKALVQFVAGAVDPNVGLYLVAGGAALLVTWVCAQVLESAGLERVGLDLNGRAVGFASAAAIGGSGLFAMVVAAAAAAGWVQMREVGAGAAPWPGIAVGALISVGLAIFEELTFRGYVLQVLARVSVPVAVVLTGMGFVAIHMPNEGGTTATAILNMFLYHLLLVALYRRTGSIWPLIAFHAAWNFTQGYVFGMPVSGATSSPGLLNVSWAAGTWTGNAFGLEGGLLVTVALVVATLGLILPAAHRSAISGEKTPSPRLPA